MASNNSLSKDTHPVIVSAVHCNSYDTVEPAVRRAIDALGGMARFASDGETILLKPNMLQAKNPDDAVTTHPEIVRTMIRLVRKQEQFQ